MAALLFARPLEAAPQSFLSDASGNLSAISAPGGGAVPIIVTPPHDQLGTPNGTASFSVSATGPAALTFQWRRGGMDLNGATGATLLLEHLAAGDFAGYSVVVSNGGNAVESDPVQLLLDTNETGMPDTWQLAHFGDLLQAPGADFDHDGVSNVDEYRDGTDPADATSHFFVLTVAPTSGGYVIIQPAQTRYAPGAPVTINAVADANGMLLEWTGDASGSATALPLVMDQNRTVNALFGVSLAQALDGPNITWATSGDGPWHGLFNPTHDGVDAAVSPLLTQGQQSRLDGTVVGQGRVTFWSRLFEYAEFHPASTTVVADSLTMELDTRAAMLTTVVRFQSPTNPWVQNTLYTTPGAHALSWLHARNPTEVTSSIASVDEVNFMPITPASGMEEISYPLSLGDQFGDPDLRRGLRLAADGNFYGTTPSGGAHGLGSFFQLTPAGVLTTLYSFDGAAGGASPQAGVMQGVDQDFYGTTSYGQGISGTVFKITSAGVLTTLHSFHGPDGKYPMGVLVADPAGNLYGTTLNGGKTGQGTVFKLTPGGTLTTLHHFQGSDGAYPKTGVTRGKDGNLYGVIDEGGVSALGVVFKVTPAGAFTRLRSFIGSDTSGFPFSGTVVLGKDGNLFGTTDNAIFKIAPTGAYIVLHTLNGDGSDGTRLAGDLVATDDGVFYGTTRTGGVNDSGTLYRIFPTGAFTVVHDFNADEEAVTPAEAPLQNGTDGKLYGMRVSGGNGVGVFYRFRPPVLPPVATTFAGTYDALVTNTSPVNGNTGFVSVRLTATGVVTGKLLFAGVSYRLLGRFDAADRFKVTFLRRGFSSIVVELRLNRDVPPTISGLISSEGEPSQLVAGVQPYSAKSPTDKAGKYTLLLPADALGNTPKGHGFALVNITTAGLVTSVGTLGDGTPWSAGGLLKLDGSVALYAGLYSPAYPFRGSIGGTLRFQPPGPDDCSGVFQWYKPAQLTGVLFKGGFTASSAAYGDRYTPPARGQRAIDLPTGHITFKDGNIVSLPPIPFSIDVNNKVLIGGTNAQKVAVTIYSASGMIHGTFLHPVRLKTKTFSGVLNQKQKIGGGVFVDVDASGSVEISAP